MKKTTKNFIRGLACMIIGHQRVVVKLTWNDNRTHFHIETYCFRCNCLTWAKVIPRLPTEREK